MFKKILIFSFFFLFFPSFTFANVSYNVSSWLRNCSEYSTINNTSGHKFIVSSINTSAPTSWSSSCEEHGYWWWQWSSRRAINTHYNCPDDRYASQIEYSWSNYRVFCKWRDDDYPLIWDVTNVNPSQYLAIDNQYYSISADGGALWTHPSSIVFIEGSYEDEQMPSGIENFNIISKNSDVLDFDWNISLVDNDRETDGWREYTFKLLEVCDEAWNCTNSGNDSNFPHEYNYNVYANTDPIHRVWGVTTNELDDSSNIADGTVKNLTITLLDNYWNEVITASWIGRTIDFNFNVNNGLYLNQYTRSLQSSVFSTIPNSWTFDNRFPIGNWITSFDLQNSSDWTYAFDFKVYTPTFNEYTYSHTDDLFIINSIEADINGTLWSYSNASIPSSNIDFHFNPLYTTSFSWDLVDYGFIEWWIQNSELVVAENSSSATGNNKSIYLEYGSWARSPVPKLEMLYSQSLNPTNIMWEWYPNYSQFIAPEFSLSTYDLITKLTMTWSAMLDLSNTYLSSHILYSLGWHTIVYNWDVIGKTNYWDNTAAWNTYQSWIKVLWATSADDIKVSEILQNQLTDDIQIIWSIYKASLKKDIIKNVYSVIKNITPNNGTPPYQISSLSNFSSPSSWVSIMNNSVLYFWDLSWDNVEVNWGTVIGQKTIIVKWGNLYISDDIKYNNPQQDILGIIVLKDENGNGGNVYIDPDVKRIDATIFAEKSLMSYNGTNILWGDTDAEILRNQLYIYGSVFSENTIGWSRKIPVSCPYYISDALCIADAQKYDLNYLRRYFIYDSHTSGAGCVLWWDWIIDDCDIAAYGWQNYQGEFNTSIYPYARNPFVIEYNPMLWINPPPLFYK